MPLGKSSQAKGAAGERELARLLTEKGFQMERGGYCFGEKPDLMGLPGIHVEVKRVEHLNLSKAMGQACSDADRFKDGAPTVFHRRSREPWLVTMRLQDWLELYEKGRV